MGAGKKVPLVKYDENGNKTTIGTSEVWLNPDGSVVVHAQISDKEVEKLFGKNSLGGISFDGNEIATSFGFFDRKKD